MLRGERSTLRASLIEASRDASDASSDSGLEGSRLLSRGMGSWPLGGPYVHPAGPPALPPRPMMAGRDGAREAASPCPAAAAAANACAASGCRVGARPGEPDGPESRGPEALPPGFSGIGDKEAATGGALEYRSWALPPSAAAPPQASARPRPPIMAVRPHWVGGAEGRYSLWCWLGCDSVRDASWGAWRCCCRCW